MRFLLLIVLTTFFAFNITNVKAGMIDYPIVKLQALDKSTARTTTFEARVGTTIEYGSLFIKIQSCRKSEPLDKPESASFIQIWEVPLNATKSEWAFSGWMFASSPALSAMDHAVYDVWVLDCLNKSKKERKASAAKKLEKIASEEDLAEPVKEEVKLEENKQEQTNGPEVKAEPSDKEKIDDLIDRLEE